MLTPSLDNRTEDSVVTSGCSPYHIGGHGRASTQASGGDHAAPGDPRALRQGLNAERGRGGCERDRPRGRVSSSRTVDPPVEGTDHWAGNFLKKGKRGWPALGAAQVHFADDKRDAGDAWREMQAATRCSSLALAERARWLI